MLRAPNSLSSLTQSHEIFIEHNTLGNLIFLVIWTVILHLISYFIKPAVQPVDTLL